MKKNRKLVCLHLAADEWKVTGRQVHGGAGGLVGDESWSDLGSRMTLPVSVLVAVVGHLRVASKYRSSVCHQCHVNNARQ